MTNSKENRERIELGAYSKNTEIYRTPTGEMISEIRIDHKNDGKPVILGVCADLHFNLCNDTDRLDEELAYTEKCRLWLAGGESAEQAKYSAEVLAKADAAVIVGDILDYLSSGTIGLMRSILAEPHPDFLLLLGGHDVTKQMQTGRPNRLPIAARLDILRPYWPNDLHYVSKRVGDRLMIIGLDNGQGKYLDCQLAPLERDLNIARSEGRAVIILEHEPICSGNPTDTDTPAVLQGPGAREVMNFFTVPIIRDDDTADATTREVYRRITANADVIRAVICGHTHSQFYGEISATTPDGTEVKIPQYTVYANPYNPKGFTARVVVD